MSKLEIRATGSLSATEQPYIDHWAQQIFAGQDMGLKWAKADWLVLVWEGEELASQVEIVERTARVGEQSVKLAGVGGVATAPAWRRRGLATLAMQQAMDFIQANLNVDFGLLICFEEKIPFYGRLGWQLAADVLVIDQPGEKMELQGPVMIWPCRGKAWPAGAIDLCGPPW